MSHTIPLKPSERHYPDKALLTGLSRFQRILMVTDGTVTELLEQYLAEKIKVNKLYECVETDIDQLIPGHKQYLTQAELPILSRSILLEGQTTKSNWLYAQSSIFLDNLIPEFRSDLLASREPIGRLWEKHRCETFKTILSFEKREAGECGTYFGISASANLISRTYEVSSNQKTIMVITEMFPESSFKKGDF